MHDDEAFLAALRARPNDSVGRLVYADWLDEQNDPPPGPAGRTGSSPGAGPGSVLAEFLRLEVRVADGGLSDDDRVAALNRMSELSRRAEMGWLCAVNRTPFVRCSVRKRSGGSPLDGTLELANYATRALLVALDADVLQHLRLRITDPLGGVSEGLYGEFRPVRACQFRLMPGERSSIRINLLNTVPVREVMAGAYVVEAIYVYDGVVSRAEPVRVELTDDDRRKWKLGRFAP